MPSNTRRIDYIPALVRWRVFSTYLPCVSPQDEDNRGNDGDHSLRVALASAVARRGNFGDEFNPANLVDVLPAQQLPDSHYKVQSRFGGKCFIIITTEGQVHIFIRFALSSSTSCPISHSNATLLGSFQSQEGGEGAKEKKSKRKIRQCLSCFIICLPSLRLHQSTHRAISSIAMANASSSKVYPTFLPL